MDRPKLTGSIDSCVPQAPPSGTRAPLGRRVPAFITPIDNAAGRGHAFQTFAH